MCVFSFIIIFNYPTLFYENFLDFCLGAPILGIFKTIFSELLKENRDFFRLLNFCVSASPKKYFDLVSRARALE